MVFSGNTTSTAESAEIDIAANITSFTLSNKSGGTIEASVGVFLGSTIVYVLFEEPLAASGTATCNFIYNGKPIRMLPNYKIFVLVTGSCDYYFTIL